MGKAGLYIKKNLHEKSRFALQFTVTYWNPNWPTLSLVFGTVCTQTGSRPRTPHPQTIRSPELQPHQCISSREQTAMDLAASAIDGDPNGEGRHLVAVWRLEINYGNRPSGTVRAARGKIRLCSRYRCLFLGAPLHTEFLSFLMLPLPSLLPSSSTNTFYN